MYAIHRVEPNGKGDAAASRLLAYAACLPFLPAFHAFLQTFSQFAKLGVPFPTWSPPVSVYVAWAKITDLGNVRT